MWDEDQSSSLGVHFGRIQPDRSVNVLRTLSNSLRVKLLYDLAQDVGLGKLAKILELTAAELKYRLIALETYGLIARRKTGCALTPCGVRLVNYLEEVSEKLEESLA